MSEETANAAPKDAKATESEPVQAPVEANARLLEESKKYKERAQQAEKKLREVEQKQLEESQNWQKAYESLKKDHEGLRKNWAKATISGSVREAAAKAGCLSVDSLLKLGDPNLLSLDEDSGAVDGVERFIESAKKDHAYLFRTSQPVVNPASPGGVTKPKGPLSAQDIAKLPQPERNKILMELYKARK